MRSIRLLVTLGLSTSAIALGACGGGDDGSRTEQAASGDAKTVFASTCGGCHTLADAGTSGKLGPNLDELEPDAAQVVRAIESGPGSMPENLVSGAEAQAVADYVAGAAGK